MIFAHPQILWLLLVFPPGLVAFFWWSWRKRQALMAQFIQARLLPGLVAGLSPQRQKVREGCLVLAVVCLILALARPQWGFSWQEVKQRGVDIVVAIDVSKSMLATDITPSRLARAKLAALDLMQQAKSDRLGLVAFAGSAFLPCPLTIDDTAFRQSVETLDVNSISQGGTALAEAIETALTAFKEGENHKILVLMTDGEDQDSGAVEAAKKAAAAGLRIYTIGIGTAEGELLRIKNPDGSSDYVRDEQGNVVKSHLNERLLQEIASTTEGGFYLPLRGAKTIDTLYSEGLSKLPKSEHEQKLVKQYYERFHWPLALALGLLLVEMLLSERKREMKSKTTPEAPKKVVNGREKAQRPAQFALLLWLLCLAAASSALASSSSALRDYKAGRYDRAQKEYEALLQKKSDDPRLHFNAGAAAYRNQQFDEAAKQFNEALASPDLKLQALAYYNRGNAQYYLGEQNPDPNKRVETWEKALKDYDLSLKLNSQDPDAKFNQDFVKKRLEELKQQQQQQNNQNKSDQQKQDQQQQQNQQNDQQKQDQKQQQQQSQQQQAQQKQDSGQQHQQGQQNPQDKQQQQQADKQSQEQKKQSEQQQAQQSAGQGKEKPEEQESEQTYAAGQMTPDQARQLMDAQKGEEKMLMLKPEEKPANPNRPMRDW